MSDVSVDGSDPINTLIFITVSLIRLCYIISQISLSDWSTASQHFVIGNGRVNYYAHTRICDYVCRANDHGLADDASGSRVAQ